MLKFWSAVSLVRRVLGECRRRTDLIKLEKKLNGKMCSVTLKMIRHSRTKLKKQGPNT